MKFLVVADTHFTDKDISSRRDSILQTQEIKFTYLVNYAIKHKVEAVLHTGDFFNRRRVSNDVHTMVYGQLRRLRVAKIPFIVVPGNHDIEHGNYDDFAQDSDLYLLQLYGALKVAARKPIKGPGYMIHGYQKGTKRTKVFLAGDDVEDYAKRKADGLYHIALIHAAIGENDNKKKGIRAVAGVNIRSAHAGLFGDIHDGFEAIKMENGLEAICFNPGSLTRMDYDDREREPRFAIFDTETEKIKYVALPFDQVFEKVKRSKKSTADIALGQEFRERLDDIKDKEETPEDLVRRKAQEHSFKNRQTQIAIKHMVTDE